MSYEPVALHVAKPTVSEPRRKLKTLTKPRKIGLVYFILFIHHGLLRFLQFLHVSLACTHITHMHNAHVEQ